jgi:hypothetical protein
LMLVSIGVGTNTTTVERTLGWRCLLHTFVGEMPARKLLLVFPLQR